MDCPSEEHIIRMKLAELKNIVSLDFDLLNRQLTVFHTNDHDIIFTYLDSLQFDTKFIETIHTDISISSQENKEKQLLYIVSHKYHSLYYRINIWFYLKLYGPHCR